MRSAPLDTVAALPVGLLTFTDRCDRCGSQAYVQVDLATGRLLFCAHHYQEFEARLRPLATSVCDERERLHAVS